MNLTVQHRENTGKGFNRRLRQMGATPGVIYGKEEPLNVSMTTNSTERFIRSMRGAKKIIDLEIESTEGKTNKTVILQDYQLSNLGSHLVHVDFLELPRIQLFHLKFQLHLKMKQTVRLLRPVV